MEYETVLTIDPGIHTGLAMFSMNENKMAPLFVDQFNVTKSAKTPEKQLDDLILKLEDFFVRYRIGKLDNVCIEGVRVWTSSLKSITSASRGNLSLLAYIVGSYYSFIRGKYPEAVIQIVDPNWKGQLPYPVLRSWCARIVGEDYSSDHIAAAVGIGLWKKGFLK
jgi:hypothetical protein